MKHSPRFTLSLLAGDIASVLVAFNLVASLRGLAVPIFEPLLVPCLLLLVSLALIDGYTPRTDLLSLDYASQHLVAICAATTGTLLFTFVLNTDGYALQQSRLVTALAFFLVGLFTLATRRLLALRRAAVRAEHAVIFVGDDANTVAFEQECARVGSTRPVLRATLDPSAVSASCSALSDLVARLESGALRAEAIVLRESARDLPAGLPDRLVQLHFAGVPTYTLELFHEVVWRKIPLYRINPAWLFQGGFHLAREPIYERAKRACDVALALFVLLIAAPFLALAALAILLDDGAPVFFRQTRVGLHRRPFTLYKLRTMRVAREGDARYTAKGDKRITRIGAFLRASRLDELPQLWNVLKGDMSMIGPRAEWDVLTRDYEDKIPCYHFRHLVRPGITGWAQVNYPYGANLDDTRRKLEYDLYYIRHYSFRLDAAIVMKTAHVMLFAKGSR